MYYTKQAISFESVQVIVIHIRFAFANSRLFTSRNTLLSSPTYGGTQYSPIFCNACRDSELLVEILKCRMYVEFSRTSNRVKYFRIASQIATGISEEGQIIQNCDMYFRIAAVFQNRASTVFHHTNLTTIAFYC